jgi:hypothetical protein
MEVEIYAIKSRLKPASEQHDSDLLSPGGLVFAVYQDISTDTNSCLKTAGRLDPHINYIAITKNLLYRMMERLDGAGGKLETTSNEQQIQEVRGQRSAKTQRTQ